MQKKTTFYLLLISALALSSCIKKEVTPLADEGKTFVKILEGPENKIFLAPFSDVRPLLLFSVRKDANSNASLQQSAPITLTRVNAMVDRYNAAHGTDYEQLPDSLYTLAAHLSRSGNTYTTEMTSGEFAKDFMINLAGSKWDLSKKYALGFALTSVGSNAVKASGRDSVLVLISVKNKYDGVYTMKGKHNRSPYNFPYEVTMHMVTAGANSVNFFWPDAGSNGHPIGTGPDPINDVSWYGAAISPALEFDLATDIVTRAYNTGSATPIVLYTGAGAPVSRYDATEKKIYAYFYYFTGAGQDFSNRGWSDTLTYVGPR